MILMESGFLIHLEKKMKNNGLSPDSQITLP